MIEGLCQRKSSVWKVHKGRRLKWTVHIEPTKAAKAAGGQPRDEGSGGRLYESISGQSGARLEG